MEKKLRNSLVYLKRSMPRESTKYGTVSIEQQREDVFVAMYKLNVLR
ncbi:hypothetical protein ACQR35_09415 [Pseudarthrobacter sp. J1738]